MVDGSIEFVEVYHRTIRCLQTHESCKPMGYLVLGWAGYLLLELLLPLDLSIKVDGCRQWDGKCRPAVFLSSLSLVSVYVVLYRQRIESKGRRYGRTPVSYGYDGGSPPGGGAAIFLPSAAEGRGGLSQCRKQSELRFLPGSRGRVPGLDLTHSQGWEERTGPCGYPTKNVWVTPALLLGSLG